MQLIAHKHFWVKMTLKAGKKKTLFLFGDIADSLFYAGQLVCFFLTKSSSLFSPMYSTGPFLSTTIQGDDDLRQHDLSNRHVTQEDFVEWRHI